MSKIVSLQDAAVASYVKNKKRRLRNIRILQLCTSTWSLTSIFHGSCIGVLHCSALLRLQYQCRKGAPNAITVFHCLWKFWTSLQLFVMTWAINSVLAYFGVPYRMRHKFSRHCRYGRYFQLEWNKKITALFRCEFPVHHEVAMI